MRHRSDGSRVFNMAASILPILSVLAFVSLGSCGQLFSSAEPDFGSRNIPTQIYTVGLSIIDLKLLKATGGRGDLQYRLEPEIPGLTFAASSVVLSGTPTTAGSYSMTYTATDENGSSATLAFAVRVVELGDTREAAVAITPGSPIRGRFLTDQTVHYFKVEMNAVADLIAATDRNHIYGDTFVRLEGQGDASEDRDYIDTLENAGPGTYYIMVELSEQSFRQSRDYALAVWSIGPENDTFDIRIQYAGEHPPTAAQEEMIDAAVEFWEMAIKENGATSGHIVTTSQWECRGVSPTFGDYIDDLSIYVYFEPIDGVGGTSGRGGPCFLRPTSTDESSGLPYIGEMRFDTAELSSERLRPTAFHEIGHVLGIGTLWTNFGLLRNPSEGAVSPVPDTHFTGERAIAAFDQVGGVRYRGAKVPVENNTAEHKGGVDTHWRESVFGDELMTPTFTVGTFAPASVVTIASLEDLGYAVNYGAAQGYSLPTSASSADSSITVHLGDDVFAEPPTVDDLPEDVIRVLSRK